MTVVARPAQTHSITIGDQDVSDAYVYLLGRLLVTRQQQIDFDREGFVWNQLIHRKPGQVDWPNPNLDVAYSEAWVAIDENSFLLVTVPEIKGRYYVVEFLNGWGETVANINDRLSRPFERTVRRLPRRKQCRHSCHRPACRRAGQIDARPAPGRARR